MPSTSRRMDTLARLIASQDPQTSVVIEDIYQTTRAEVERRIQDVFPVGLTEAPVDDEAFRWQVFAAAEWVWFIVSDTALAEMRNVVGITDVQTWLNVEAAVKRHVVEAMTTLRRLAATPRWCEDQDLRDATAPQVGAVAKGFKSRLTAALVAPKMPFARLARKETP